MNYLRITAFLHITKAPFKNDVTGGRGVGSAELVTKGNINFWLCQHLSVPGEGTDKWLRLYLL